MDTNAPASRNKYLDTFYTLYAFILAGLGIYFRDWYAVGFVGSALVGCMLIYIWRDMPAIAAPGFTRYRQLKQNGGSHTAAEWRAKCEEYDWRCGRCGRRRPLTKDHIVAVAQGGTDDITNIQPLCRPCNSSKNKTTIYYPALACHICGGTLDGNDYALLRSAQTRGARFGGCKVCRGKA